MNPNPVWTPQVVHGTDDRLMFSAQVREASTFPTHRPNQAKAHCLSIPKGNTQEEIQGVSKIQHQFQRHAHYKLGPSFRNTLYYFAPELRIRRQLLSPISLTSEPPNDVISSLIDCKSFSYSNHRSMARAVERKSTSVVFIIPARSCRPPSPSLTPLLPAVSNCSCIGRSLGWDEKGNHFPGMFNCSQHPHRQFFSINL